MAYSDEVLADTPLAYWEAEETNGLTLSDSSGNGNAASLANNYDLAASGLISEGGSAIEALEKIVECDFGTALSSLSDVTFELWFQPSEIPATERNLMEAGASGNGLQLTLDTAGIVHLYQAGDGVHLTSATALSVGTAYHIVGVNDTSGAIRLYINAVEEDTFTGTVNSGTGGNDGRFCQGTLSPAGAFGSAITDGALGIYDEVAGYSTALSATRVQAHYDAGAGSTAVTGTGVKATTTYTANTATSSVGAATGTATKATTTFTAGTASPSVGAVTGTGISPTLTYTAHMASAGGAVTGTGVKASYALTANTAVGLPGVVTGTSSAASYRLVAKAASYAVGAVGRQAQGASLTYNALTGTPRVGALPSHMSVRDYPKYQITLRDRPKYTITLTDTAKVD